MDIETFKTSARLVHDISGEVWEYLDDIYPEEDWDKNDLIDSCDTAIQEINSWKKAITSFKPEAS